MLGFGGWSVMIATFFHFYFGWQRFYASSLIILRCLLFAISFAPRLLTQYPTRPNCWQAMGAIDVASAKKRGDIDAALKKTAPNDQIRAFLMSNVVKGASGGFAWRINVDALNAHFESLMVRVGWRCDVCE